MSRNEWPDVKTTVELMAFSLEELKALGRILEHQYIAYDDEEAHLVVNKIFKILRENKANAHTRLQS